MNQPENLILRHEMTDLVMPNKETTTLHVVIGFILAVATCLAGVFLFYGFFMERENYFNKLALYKWLKSNSLPDPKRIKSYAIWQVGDIEITYAGDKFFVFSENDLVISSFVSDYFDKRRTIKIMEILKSSL